MADAGMRSHAVIIGASSGIGAACAQRLVVDHHVTGISRRGTFPVAMDDSHSLALACDAGSLEDLKASLATAVERFGKISKMVVTAGMQLIKPVRTFKEQEVLDVLRTNVGVPFFCASLFASQKFTQADAVLCLVSSIAANRAEPGIVLYGATKAATESLVGGLARELAPRRVVGVSPGWLDTPMTRRYDHVYTPEFIASLTERSPLGLAQLDDVVDGIAFLTSAQAAKITGQVLVVDGGASL